MSQTRASIVGVLLLTTVMVGCGPSITDPSRLPESITVCGWKWKHDVTVAPMTLAEAEALRGATPVVVDLASLLCPAGACTDADVRAGNLARDACHDVIWARTGFQTYVQYGMVFRL
jgi:hypothetical protein